MASSTYIEQTEATKDVIWSFLQNKEAWATLIPGYLHHEIQSDSDMIWVFKGDFGIVEKAVKLQLKVKEAADGRIAFDLIGLSDNINGSGSFAVADIDGKQAVEGVLNMKAGGFLAAAINPVLEKFVPQTIEAHVKAMAQQIA